MEALPRAPVVQADFRTAAGNDLEARPTVTEGVKGRAFLSTLAAGPRERRVALAVVLVSFAAFVAAVPFARTMLPQVDAFIPAYQSALALNDLITAAILFGQYSILRTPSLRILASGYLFTALMVFVHTLSFPGVFAPTGLLGAGPQSTAWLYMFWHGGFPLFVLGYAGFGRADALDAPGAVRTAMLWSIAGVIAAVIFFTLLVTQWQALLPAVMDGNKYSSSQVVVISVVYLLSVAALVALWRKRPHSVLDLWLMVVMCAWLFDMALGAVLNNARYDLGWYTGRIYGLAAASFVLMLLLVETRALYARLVQSVESERLAAETRAHDLQEVNRALRDSQDELRRLNETLEDRARERAVQLAATERRHRNLLDVMQESIWIQADGKIVYANAAAARLLGVGRATELIGLPASGWVHPNDRERAAERSKKLRSAPCSLPVTQLRFLTRDGKIRLADIQAVSFLQDGKLHVMASARDVTALREAETKLQQAQKMESVGQLTGGVAHDFNNLLTVIIGGLDVAMERIPSEIRPAIEGPLQAAERGAGLVKQMLAFSRRQVLQPQVLALNDTVSGMAELLRRTLGEDIEIEMKLNPDLWQALADKGQVENALLNLAINARDAMPEGGKLTIESGNARLDEEYAARNTEVAPGDYVMLAVTDTGSGMPADVIARAIEPFFTTKPLGKGSGLGLSMIFGFAKQSGGHMRIYSEVGHGTTVRLYLPRQAADASVAEPTPVASTEQPRGGEWILVVEDDELVRNITVAHLRTLGYRVIEASDGAQARKILESDVPIDLMFTDVVMPGGMTGRQLAELALERRPGLRMLYTSGYTEDSIAHQGKLKPGVHFLSKPFRRQELAKKVRAALEA